ncbi:MAG: methyltransferase domain-containing protein [Pseudomonadales bacterium]
MNVDSFFTDHWREIEDERIVRYEQMFRWHDGQRALLAGADLAPGQRVLDLGAGPGFFALGLAELVAPDGRVDGVDLNPRFVEDANQRAAGQPRVRFHQVTDHLLPFDDGSFDRVICKNVLEYVPDLAASLTECARILKPGGRIHIIDSDWGFVVVEPWGKATVERFFAAAAPAFKEPCIGRKAAGALVRAGFSEVSVALLPIVDREGGSLNVLTNMAGYIRSFASLPEAEVAGLLDQARAGVQDGSYLFCLPQFLVTGSKGD